MSDFVFSFQSIIYGIHFEIFKSSNLGISETQTLENEMSWVLKLKSHVSAFLPVRHCP